MAFTIVDVQRMPGDSEWIYGQGVKYTIPFKVFFTDAYDESALIHNSDARIPVSGNYLGFEAGHKAVDVNTYCSDLKCTLLNDSQYGTGANGIALVVCTFLQVNPQFNPNPLQRVDIVWGGAEDTYTPTTDVNGFSLANSAGELYTGIPQIPIRGAECTVTIRQTANPAAMIAAFSYSTNSLPCFGGNVGAENGLMGKITARYTQESTLKYWEATFPMKFRRDNWRWKPIDNGTVFINSDNNHQTITDDVGQTKQQTTLLDGTGQALDIGGTPVIFPSAGNGPGATDPNGQPWDKDGYPLIEKMDWNTLGLPNIFTYA